MTQKQIDVCSRLKRLGFTKGNQMRLYGAVFDFLGEPLIVSEDLVLVDAADHKTGETRRVRIPLPIVHMATADRRFAA
jgi:hypothetical protein